MSEMGKLFFSHPLTELFSASSGATEYSNLFAAEFASSSSVNALAVNTGLDSAQEDASGYFTILVMRQQHNPLTVTIDASPMKITNGDNNYLGYRIIGQWAPTQFIISTVEAPGFPVEGITYEANRRPNAGANVRDYRVFKYEIPKNRLAAVGTYSANVSFTISPD